MQEQRSSVKANYLFDIVSSPHDNKLQPRSCAHTIPTKCKCRYHQYLTVQRLTKAPRHGFMFIVKHLRLCYYILIKLHNTYIFDQNENLMLLY